MNNKSKSIFQLIIAFIVVFICYNLLNYINLESIDSKIFFNRYTICGFILLISLLLIFIDSNHLNRKDSKFKDKLFKSLTKNSDTIYIIMEYDTNKILYLSDNVNDVLGLKVNNEQSKAEIASEIFNIQILKEELKSWDGDSEYVSQMLAYTNPSYNHKTWIKIKIYPYNEKNDQYKVVQISNVNKEHDRQHLLITQTNDIKAREKQLNQITADSYDVEMNIDINTNKFNMQYFKTDMKYFGNEREGNFKEEISDIISTYINKNDQNEVKKVLSYDNLKFLIDNNVLDPISIRYRIGNEIKDNTWLESTIFFVATRDSINISILTKNVTENAESIREQNILLQNALNEARNASVAKNELISTISHEIRTPMTTIKGLSESAINKKIEGQVKEDMENIHEASIDVISIIDGLLDISKIEKRAIKKEQKEYNLSELIENVYQNALELIGTKPIKLNLNIDNNLPIILLGDNKRLNQVLTEVLNNAVKYTDEGEINFDIRGEKKNNTVNLIFTVKDSGCGIESNKLSKIFNKKNETGLVRVKKLIELLKGSIEIESKENIYTEVTIKINKIIVEDNKIRKMMKSNDDLVFSDFNNKKILIVDDNKLNLKVAKRLLEPYSVMIDMVESGFECLEKVSNDHYDLILLDQMMPGMDGIATLNKIRDEYKLDIPVVVLTADAIVGQKEMYLESGFDDYLSKPIDKSELNRIITKYLN